MLFLFHHELKASPLLKALHLIQNSKIQEAAELLEKSYNTESGLNNHLDEALLLLTLEDVQLKQPRHYYASFVLDNAKKLNPQQKTNFTQIAVEGYFKKGDFERAKLYAIKCFDINELTQDFKNTIRYQLAWILVNQNQYASAINELKTLLKMTENSIFQDKIVHDLGIFEGEQFGKNAKYIARTYSEIVKNKPHLEPHFVFGFIKGLERWNQKPRSVDLARIADIELREHLARHYALDESPNKLKPCDQIQFFKLFKRLKEDESPTLKVLAACFNQEGYKNAKDLSEIYNQISQRTVEIYPYTKILSQQGEQQKSCHLLDQIYQLPNIEINIKENILVDFLNSCFLITSVEKKWMYLKIALEDQNLKISKEQKKLLLSIYLGEEFQQNILELWPLISEFILNDAKMSYLYFNFLNANTGTTSNNISISHLNSTAPSDDKVLSFSKNINLLTEAIKSDQKSDFNLLLENSPAFLNSNTSPVDWRALRLAIDFNLKQSGTEDVQKELIQSQKMKTKINQYLKKIKYPILQNLLKETWKAQLRKTERSLKLSENKISQETYKEIHELLNEWKNNV